jgi:hypothetical protein
VNSSAEFRTQPTGSTNIQLIIWIPRSRPRNGSKQSIPCVETIEQEGEKNKQTCTDELTMRFVVACGLWIFRWCGGKANEPNNDDSNLRAVDNNHRIYEQ